MQTDELHKFSDGMLNDVRTTLHDINAGLRMEYLPMRKWSQLDRKRARVMVQNIDRQLDDEQIESENDDDGSDEEKDVEESAHTQSDEEKFDYEESNDDDEPMDNEDDEEVKELYDDVNVNLRNADAEMTDTDQGPTEQHVSQEEEEDAHVTLTHVHDATKADEPLQSSSAVDVAVQLQTNKLREEAQAENEDFLNKSVHSEEPSHNVEEAYKGGPIGYVKAVIQNRRDLPRDIPLNSVEVLRYDKRSKSDIKGKVPTEMELILEQTQ
nr:hypothetical protein [Tanacetum cinerariifolium]